jgi:hypothetical protein
MAANKGARGAWFFTNEAGASPNQPESFDEGVSKLEAGQSALVLSVDASNIDSASKVNADVTAYLANSYSVPPYQMPSGQATGTRAVTGIPSGIALVELNRPLTLQRQRRFKLNESSMDRVFHIETALASIEAGTDVAVDVVQKWQVLPVELHKTDTELLTELKAKQELGVVDAAQIVVETNDSIETREEAQAYLDELTPVVVATPQGNTGIGLPGRRAPNA